MGVSNFTGPRESKLTIPRARKMAKHSKIPRIVNEIPGNLRANSQEKAVKLERKDDSCPISKSKGKLFRTKCQVASFMCAFLYADFRRCDILWP